MSTQTQLRRGTSSACDSMTPADSEMIIDTTNRRARIGDGSTAGGIHIPNYRDLQNQIYNSGVTTGLVNAYILTNYKPCVSLGGMPSFEVSPNITNTGPSQINVDGLGNITIKKVSAGTLSDLAAGDFVSGVIYRITYNGTYFQLIGAAAGGTGLIKQAGLDTSIGAVSTLSNAYIMFTLPGGEYGFYPQVKSSSTSNVPSWKAQIYPNTSTGVAPGTSYITKIGLQSTGIGSETIFAQQRYINSSPPYELFDGETGGYLFLLLNKDGKIMGHYLADAPPWAYNGPTKIKADRICFETGKRFRNVLSKQDIFKIMEGAPPKFKEQEITPDIVNKDMGIIPHPFSGYPEDWTPVLINPYDRRVRDLVTLINQGYGDEAQEIITDQHLNIDNSPMNIRGPDGVPILRFKMRGNK